MSDLPPPPPPPPLPPPPSSPAVTPRPEPLASSTAGESNTMGTLALVFGLSAFVCLPLLGGILAMIFGILGLAKAKQIGGRGRGMSIAGIVLAIINFIMSIAFVILLIVIIGAATEGAFERIGGTASPSTYEVEIRNCTVDALGAAEFDGVIKNLTESSKSFMVATDITDSFGTVLDSMPVPVIDIPPGGSRPWQAIAFSDPVGDITCRVTGVNNLLN
jgi:hypothetical protein